MIIVDSSVWIDHFRTKNAQLIRLLETGQVLVHPFVIGELALGSLRQRDVIIEFLKDLPAPILADDIDVLNFIETHQLANKGIGYIDAHLLVSAKLSNTVLWTHDKRLHAIACSLNLGFV